VRDRIWDRLTAAVLLPLAVVGATMSGAAAAAANPGPAAGPSVPVIVRYAPTGAQSAESAVHRAGGTIGLRLGIIDAFAAKVPLGTLRQLSLAAGVLAVSPDAPVDAKAADWMAEPGANTMYSVTGLTGARDVWGKVDAIGRKVTGKGVGVAVIDSGVTPAKGLDNSAKIVNGPDLSFESQAANLRYLDTFGHGTHMAGIIAGRDPEVVSGAEGVPTRFVGMAPDATLVNLKVAAANGATDVSQVIAAIDWVVTHRNDTGLNIRVLNLSFGTDSTQDPRYDPLSYAVEQAWRKGIVVVAAAGNDGATDTRVSDPAINPYVIAVGASDTAGTDARTDDTLAPFSTRGDTNRHADLIAPGRSIVSLRDPNSFIDTNYASGRLPASTDSTGRLFRGSGTSQAAAVVSGAAALLLQQRPTLTPDQVKKLLTSTAQAVAGADSIGQGAGQLNVSAAANAPTPAYSQTWPAALGTGTLEGARGNAHVADPVNGVVLTGEKDIMGKAWKPATWCPLAASGTAWSGGTWNGTTWSGTTWSSLAWAGRTWSGTTWSGTTWSGTTWSGRTWSNAVWTGTTWSGTTWTGTTWSGRTWSGGYWSSGAWE
jgi:serine protease AprX